MFARSGVPSASSYSGGSAAQPSLTTTTARSSKPPTLNSSTPSSGDNDAGDTGIGATVPLAARFQNIGQVARILARVAQAQSTLHAQGELPGDVDLAAMVHLTQDMTAALRAIRDLKATMRQRQTPSSCRSSAPSSVQRRRRQTTTPRQPKRCVECCTTKTPEWRSGPEGPRSLCNVCGLLYAKYLREQRLRAG